MRMRTDCIEMHPEYLTATPGKMRADFPQCLGFPKNGALRCLYHRYGDMHPKAIADVKGFITECARSTPDALPSG